ncbi:MAG: MmgE/PrpD family protein [Deltaproteobacteria bacterium]|nr:MmgE/PrpD family protein [Deltaproteobacteria bacterium]
MQAQSAGMTAQLARFIVDTDASLIPDVVFDHAKVAFMDWFAVTMAGKDEPLVHKLLRYAELTGGAEQATILGHGLKKTISQAALINGAASHALDYDDTMAFFLGHPSVTLFPGLLSLSEWKKINGMDFLAAYIIGLKAGMTIASCAGADHYAAGWHATSTMGHLASAAACSRLLNLDEQQTVYALGIAGTQSSGLKRSFGTMCKPLHAGLASEAGVMAALLAGDGFTAAEDIIEGPNGLFQAMKGSVRQDILSTLGQTWGIEHIAQKYHASCHFTHSPIEAALFVFQKQGLAAEDIKSIRVYVSDTALTAADKTDARTGLEGKFSIPYCVANALLRGNTGLQAFSDEKVSDPLVKDLMRKLHVTADPETQGMESRIEIETTDGQVHSAFKDIFREIPELDVKKKKISAKFADLCEPVLGADKTQKLMDAFLSLEKIENLATLIKML